MTNANQQENACSFAFCASTGRTATMFVAKTLNALSEVTAFHEGHLLDGTPTQRLPLIKTVDELRS